MGKRTKQLIRKYPNLFANVDGIECNEGWLELIRVVCVYFQQLIDSKQVNSIKFSQIKEKFGLLRIYFDVDIPDDNKAPKNNLSEIIHNFVWSIENVSGIVCEDCGKMKNENFNVKTRRPKNHWIRTLCDNCFAEDKKRQE